MDSHRTTTVESLTLEEFERLPNEEGFRLELVRGMLAREPGPGFRHGWLANRLGHYLEVYAEETRRGLVSGEAGFVLVEEPPTVRFPDVAWVSTKRFPSGEELPERYVLGGPDLAVEIVSPFDRLTEIQEKVFEYLAAGTRMVWIVDPDTRSVTVWRSRDQVRALTVGDQLDGSDVLPGFRLDVSTLFHVPRSRSGE